MSAKPILYNSYHSSCSWRVRIALNLKGIEYEYKAVDLNTDQQFAPDFQRLNPLHQVPALVVDGEQVVVESYAIIEYLEERYANTGAPVLLPKDPVLRAKARAIALAVVAGIQPLQNDSVCERSSGRCCVGDEVSVADVCLAPQVFNAINLGIDIKDYPTISKINTYLMSLDAFESTHPYRQTDCPPELRIK
ncbi:unnamed protein product [Oppiella nova]|uniref:Maleylacetoacetate isomerase n=1 Tax=Oppiella nova TaxID=334625 RepID=A0A7R9QG87_9ACAR|nr:unnamed protein product [Oppiella nova]CAG2164389.1 unnamed protein product [Oppiella nova]